MTSLMQTFNDLNFEVGRLNWRTPLRAWRKRRANAQNLARLSARDLRDLGINPAQFEFDLNHGGTENKT